MPFIAITEKAFARLVNEQYELLQRSIAVQRRLEQLVLDERGLDEVTRALSAAIGGTVRDARRPRRAAAQRRTSVARSPPPALDGDPRRGRMTHNAAARTAPFEPVARGRSRGRALALPVAPDVAGRPAGLARRLSATAARSASSSD